MPNENLLIVLFFQHFVYLERLSENEVVAVGVNPVAIIEQLPAVLKKKKFGAT